MPMQKTECQVCGQWLIPLLSYKQDCRLPVHGEEGEPVCLGSGLVPTGRTVDLGGRPREEIEERVHRALIGRLPLTYIEPKSDGQSSKKYLHLRDTIVNLIERHALAAEQAMLEKILAEEKRIARELLHLKDKRSARVKRSFLETKEDMDWLTEVHGAPPGYACAILHGNEDYPHRVELFARNHVQCKPTVMKVDEDGKMHVVETGEEPVPKKTKKPK